MNILKHTTPVLSGLIITLLLIATESAKADPMPKARIAGKPVPVTGDKDKEVNTYGSYWEESYYTPKTFKISDTKSIIISRANLYYRASTNEWGMGAYQWESLENNTDINIKSRDTGFSSILGNTQIDNVNSQIGENDKNPIDLFGWGTSGWDSGAKCYQPYSTSEETQEYWVGGEWFNTLTGENKRADWGSSYDGGRVLTEEEWDYLLNKRYNAEKLHGIGSLHCTIRNTSSHLENIEGLFLFPDEYDGNTNLSEPIEKDEWFEMEKRGAIFLPTTGYRRGTKVYCTEKLDTYTNKATDGYYWTASTSTSYYKNNAKCLIFKGDGSMLKISESNRCIGCAVRLVYDVERIAETMYIKNAGELKNFRDKVNHGEIDINAELTADIELDDENWTPIGVAEHAYIGSFDGNGHVIKNIKITSQDALLNAGLFGYAGSGAQIKNLTTEGQITLTNSGAIGAANVGGIVGQIELTEATPVTLENLTNKTNIDLAGSILSCIAGIAGNIKETGVEGIVYIRRCSNYGEIKTAATTQMAIGGIVGQGYIEKLHISNCANYGDIIGGDNKSTSGIAGLTRLIQSTMSYNLNCGTASTALANVVSHNDQSIKETMKLHGMNNFYANELKYDDIWKGYGIYELPEIPATGVGNEELSSGKTTYMLNMGKNGGETWRQNIGEDAYPVLDQTHKKVYVGYKHGETAITYGNEQLHLQAYDENAEDEESGNHETSIYQYTEDGYIIKECLICGHKTSEKATSIAGIKSNEGMVMIYDLSGRRVNTTEPMQRGIYIKSVNGYKSKIIIK